MRDNLAYWIEAEGDAIEALAYSEPPGAGTAVRHVDFPTNRKSKRSKRMSGKLIESLRAAEKRLDSARRANDPKAILSALLECKALYEKSGNMEREAECFVDLGDIALFPIDNTEPNEEQAASAYQRALSLFLKARSEFGPEYCYEMLGLINLERSELNAAKRAFEQSIEWRAEYSIGVYQARCYQGLGVIAARQGAYKEAVEAFVQARLRHADRRSFTRENEAAYWEALRGDAECSFSIGRIAYLVGEYPEAEKQLQRSIVLFRESESVSGEANSRRLLGRVLELTKGLHEAIEEIRLAFALYDKIQNISSKAICCFHLSSLYLKTKDYKNCSVEFSHAYNLYKSLNDLEGMANCNLIAAAQSTAKHNYGDARAYSLLAYNLYNDCKSNSGKIAAVKVLGHALQSELKSNYQNISEFLKLSTNIDEKYLDSDLKGMIDYLRLTESNLKRRPPTINEIKFRHSNVISIFMEKSKQVISDDEGKAAARKAAAWRRQKSRPDDYQKPSSLQTFRALIKTDFQAASPDDAETVRKAGALLSAHRELIKRTPDFAASKDEITTLKAAEKLRNAANYRRRQKGLALP